MNGFKRSWAAVLIAAGSASAAEPMALRFEDLPALVAGNGRVSGAREMRDAARGKTGHSARSLLPKVEGEAGRENFRTGRYDRRTQTYGGVTANLNAFKGGRDALEETALRAHADLAASSAEETLRRELAQARRLYWSLVYAREMAKTIDGFLEQNERLLAGARRRVERGLSADTDRLEFEMHALQVEEERESLLHEVTLIQMELAPLLGRPVETVFVTTDTVSFEDSDPLMAVSAPPEEAPGVRHLRAQAAVARAQGRALRQAWTPSLDLYGGYYLYTLRDRDFLDEGDRDDTVAGVKLSVALFDGNQAGRAGGSLIRQSAALTGQAAYAAQSWSAQVRVAKEELKHQRELLDSSQKQIGLGRKYLSRTLGEYDRGVKNSPDVLGALQRQLGLERQYAERRRGYHEVRADLMALVGQ